MDMRGANHTLKIQKSRWLPTSTSSWSARGQVGTSEWASCTQSRSELLPRWERRGLQIPQNGPAPEIATWVVGSLDLLWKKIELTSGKRRTMSVTALTMRSEHGMNESNCNFERFFLNVINILVVVITLVDVHLLVLGADEELLDAPGDGLRSSHHLLLQWSFSYFLKSNSGMW